MRAASTRGLRQSADGAFRGQGFLRGLERSEQLVGFAGEGLIGTSIRPPYSPDTNWTPHFLERAAGHLSGTRARSERVQSFGASGGFVIFSPDSRGCLFASAHTMALWETGTWRRHWEIPRHTAASWSEPGAFSPTVKRIALCPEVNLLQTD